VIGAVLVLACVLIYLIEERSGRQPGDAPAVREANVPAPVSGEPSAGGAIGPGESPDTADTMETVDTMETANNMDVATTRGQEDAISDIPLGGTGVVGNLGIGGARRARRARNGQGELRPVRVAALPCRISGPFAHKNLAVYLLHGGDGIAGRNYLTLEEALAQKKVVVHETEEVGKLAVENVSPHEVFIQAGDIVKGGKQDRVIGYDVVLAPNSGRVPIASFCVEQGRWSRRGHEVVEHFETANNMAVGKSMKMGFRSGGGRSQRMVWGAVSEVQEKLGANLAKSVRKRESATSLQLTLEDEDVKVTADEYVEMLGSALEGKSDVIGYVFAVNSEVNSGDVYASAALFRKLWPRLLRASAVEAVAELKKGDPSRPPPKDEVRKLVAHPCEGKARVTQVAGRIEEIALEYDDNVLYESRDKGRGGRWIRRSYIKKQAAAPAPSGGATGSRGTP
jgi:hypothetical protein